MESKERNEQRDEDELIQVTLDMDIDILDDLPCLIEVDNITSESIVWFKNVFLSTITRLYNMIDFLQRELDEKNLLVRTLLTSR